MKHLRYLLMAALVAMPLTACDEDNDAPIVEPDPVGTVTGTVSAEGTGLSGVSVTLVGSATQSATTGAGGSYTFTNVVAGSYGVAIDASTHPDVAFSQTSKTTSITTNGETATVNFDGSYVRTAAITGVVSASGAPLAGVSVVVTGGPDAVSNSSVTNAGGEFSATGLRAGTYTVTISNLPSGVTFSTVTQSVTVATGESKAAHFPGQAVQLATISGAVTVDNVGTAGIAVALSGGATASTETGPGGAFAFTGLTPGSYTVTITAPADVTFTTLSKNITVNAGQTGVVNFAGKGPSVPSTVSIQGITAGAGVPVVLTNVFGQIEVSLNIGRGDLDLDRVEVLIDDAVVASQKFTAPAPGAEAAPGDEEVVTLSVPTTQVRKVGDFYVPVVFNGGATISANLYEVGATAPIPSNEVPVVMNNPDVLMLGNAAFTPNTATPTVTVGGTTWYTGNGTFTGPMYLSFSTKVPTAVTWSDAGTAGCAASSSLTGTATAGIAITNVYNCAGKEGTVKPNAVAAPTFAPAPPPAGPDGSTVVYPTTGFSTLGAPFMLDSEDRWFLIPPAFPAANPLTLNLDNKAPTVEVHGQNPSTLGVAAFKVAFKDGFDQWWVNASYPFLQDVATSDGGVGVDAATRTTYKWNGATSGGAGVCTTSSDMVTTGADLDETVASDGTPDGYKLCASAEDLLGNMGYSLVSNWFGVDKVAPTVRIHGTTAATPGITGVVPGVSATANTSIYNIASAMPYAGADLTYPTADDWKWGLEALDSRSGFDQGGGVAGYPANQKITRTTQAGVLTYTGAAAMNIPLSDNFVRTAAEEDFLGGFAQPGYYMYTGSVADRAGNVGTTFTRNWLVDDANAPTIAFLSYAQTFYAPGMDANFIIFGQDDLEVINATLTLDYPTVLGGTIGIQHTQAVGARWDGLSPFDAAAFTTAITGVTVTVPNILGRYDFTCAGAGAPYTNCGAVNTITTAVGDFNTDLGGANGDARDLLPSSATPTMFEDAGGNMSIAGAAVPFNVLQWSDTTRAPWLDDRDTDGNQDLITWRIFSASGTVFSAEHMAPTSIEEPFFDSVVLVRNNGGVILNCGTFSAPVLTDNGINRFWTYNITKPVAGTLCGDAAGTYHAMGILDYAALLTQGI